MKRRSNSYNMSSKTSQQEQQRGVFARTTRFFRSDNNNNNNKEPSKVRIRIKEPQYELPLSNIPTKDDDDHKDFFNYALLIVLYTLQGIPMGLSASIPFLIQQKMKAISASTTAGGAAAAAALAGTTSKSAAAAAAAASYNANAIFALCSWPFSLKLLWAPIVDACFFRNFGRRKSWLVPVQSLAGLLMVAGSNFVERQLGLESSASITASSTINVKGVTVFFFVLYFLMATQDIAVDGWSLTMLSKKNRGRGPVCNSIGQNIGYFLSFVGFLALNDTESSETLWRPLLGLKSNPNHGLVSLGTFIRFMGYLMLATTAAVALFKKEVKATLILDDNSIRNNNNNNNVIGSIFKNNNNKNDDDDDKELDASEIGLKETYHRLWAVCQLPSVRCLFLILLTYRLPTSLSDNVKFLKAVEYGLSKSTTALLSPTVILPLGIIVPIVATRIWHDTPLHQFMTAYKFRVTLVPILDVLMLLSLQGGKPTTASGLMLFWAIIILSTACQAIVNSMQFNAQMTFFAKRVDPAIGGSYMTLLNTAANLGGTWPASMVMWLVSLLSREKCTTTDTGLETCTTGRDPFFILQAVFSALGCLWIFVFGKRVDKLSHLPDDAWRTHILLDENTVYDEEALLSSVDVELSAEKKDTDKRK